MEKILPRYSNYTRKFYLYSGDSLRQNLYTLDVYEIYIYICIYIYIYILHYILYTIYKIYTILYYIYKYTLYNMQI